MIQILRPAVPSAASVPTRTSGGRGGGFLSAVTGVNSGNPIEELKTRVEAMAVALVSTDGRVLGSSLPSGVYGDMFAAMCATIAGAARTLSEELHHSPPESLVIRANDFTLVISKNGTGTLLVTVVGPAADLARVVREVDRFALANH
jgi:predicted regulator of Ras-like GTPase activity (Roadblock/LC7/MglB family)